MAVHAHRLLGNVALGVDQAMEDAAGRRLVDDLDRADLEQPVALGGLRPVVSVSSTISRMIGPCVLPVRADGAQKLGDLSTRPFQRFRRCR